MTRDECVFRRSPAAVPKISHVRVELGSEVTAAAAAAAAKE